MARSVERGDWLARPLECILCAAADLAPGQVSIPAGQPAASHPQWPTPSGAVLLAGLVSLIACGGDPPSAPASPPVASVTVSPVELALLPGEVGQLGAVARTGAGTVVAAAPSWVSTVPTVASVSPDGRVTAIAPGITTVRATIGGRSGSARVTVEARMVTVTVVVGSGVASTWPAGVASYPAGTRLIYAFSARPGFELPIVRFNGVATAPAGEVTLTGDLAVLAMADSILVIPPTDAPLLQRMRALRTAPDPGAFYRAIQQDIDALYQSVTASEARRRLLDAAAVAFDPVLDAGPLWQAIQSRTLAGAESGSLPSRASGAASERCAGVLTGAMDVAFLYVNGVNTDLSDACNTVQFHLAPILASAGFGDPERFPRAVSLNSSMSEVNGGPLLCLTMVALGLRRAQEAVLANPLACAGIAGDLVEAVRQIPGTRPPLKDSEQLADTIQAVWSRGGRVVIIAHSQGNLLAREALQVLRSRTTPDGMACVGLAAVAPPIKLTRPGSEPAASDLIVRGTGVAAASGLLVRSMDILLLPELAGFTEGLAEVFAPHSGLSDWWDEYLAGKTAGASADAALSLRILAGTVLHSMDDSYLEDGITRALLRAQIQGQVAAVTSRCPAPPGHSVARHYVASIGNGFGPSDLYTVDARAAGTDHLVGRIRTVTGLQPVITDLALAPDGSLWGVSFTRLYLIDKATAIAVDRGALGLSDVNALGADVQGRLYGATQFGRFIQINASTGTASAIGLLGAGYASDGDLAFAPDGVLFGTLRTSIGTSVLVTINTATGAATPIGTVSGVGITDVWGLAFEGARLIGFTSGSGGHGEVIEINRTTGRGTIIRPLSFNAGGAAVGRAGPSSP